MAICRCSLVRSAEAFDKIKGCRDSALDCKQWWVFWSWSGIKWLELENILPLQMGIATLLIIPCRIHWANSKEKLTLYDCGKIFTKQFLGKNVGYEEMLAKCWLDDWRFLDDSTTEKIVYCILFARRENPSCRWRWSDVTYLFSPWHSHIANPSTPSFAPEEVPTFLTETKNWRVTWNKQILEDAVILLVGGGGLNRSR